MASGHQADYLLADPVPDPALLHALKLLPSQHDYRASDPAERAFYRTVELALCDGQPDACDALFPPERAAAGGSGRDDSADRSNDQDGYVDEDEDTARP